MKLYDGLKGRFYNVKAVKGEEATQKRLAAMGIQPGATVRLMQLKNSGALVIKVYGSRLALGKGLVDMIDIREAL